MSKPRNTHAAHRYVRRTALPKKDLDNVPTYSEVEHEALHGQLLFLRRLTVSRSLGAVELNGHVTFIVVQRKTRQPITVFTAQQAADHLGMTKARLFKLYETTKEKAKKAIDWIDENEKLR